MDDDWGLEPGEGFSDGSVKWPRWFCLASGGMSLVQLDQEGNEVRWHAATFTKECRHVAVNTEMYAMAAAAVYAPDQADFTLWADCQSVVSGFAQLETVADDHKNFYAGIWRDRGRRWQGKASVPPRQRCQRERDPAGAWYHLFLISARVTPCLRSDLSIESRNFFLNLEHHGLHLLQVGLRLSVVRSHAILSLSLSRNSLKRKLFC